MHTQTPDFPIHATTTEATPLSRIFIKRLLRNLAAVLPIDAQENPEEFAEEWEAARELFDSMQPRTPLEAVLAARAVACHYRNMDMHARAAKRGLSDEKALRLNASANAAGRSFDAALRALEKLRRKDAADRPAVKPARVRQETVPTPDIAPLQPRDSHGNPIPPRHDERMTRAQRRPSNPDFAAEAIAEPMAMDAAANSR